MLWKIIALAVAGLVSGAAFAQSNVTVYGTLDMSYLNDSLDTKNTVLATGVSTKTNYDAASTGWQNGILSTNVVGLRGSEDLGNGLKALFQVEMGMTEANVWGADSTDDTANAFTFRKQNIGLQGNFGAVTIGRQGVLMDEAFAVGSAGAKNNAIGSLYTSVNNTYNEARANELITYTSPNFSGITVAAQYGKGKTDADTKTAGVLGVQGDMDNTLYGFSAKYENGPIALTAGYYSQDLTADSTATNLAALTGSDTQIDSWLVGGSYNFGVAKIYGQWFDGSRDTKGYTGNAATTTTKQTNDLSGWELGVTIPLGQFTLIGSYFDTSYDGKTTGTTGVAANAVQKQDGDRDGYQLAALYSLSKRTTAYAAYANTDYDQSTKTAAVKTSKWTSEATQYTVGVRHTF